MIEDKEINEDWEQYCVYRKLKDGATRMQIIQEVLDSVRDHADVVEE